MFYTYYKKYGNSILLRYIDDDGKKHTKKFNGYEPSLYVHSEEHNDASSIFGKPLMRIKFPSMKDAKEFMARYDGVENMEICGNRMMENQCIIEMFDGESPEFDSSLIDVGIIDIETDYDDFPDVENPLYEIRQIAVYSSVDDTIYSMGLRDYTHNPDNEEIGDCEVVHIKYDTEEEFLRNFVIFMERKAFDMTSGWNSQAFDMPYIINRITKVLGEKWAKRLSPFGLIFSREEKNKYGNVEIVYDIVGCPHIDYMLLYKKHTYTPREKYSLDHIAHCELGTNKLDYGNEESLNDLYANDPQRYIEYNIQDVNLIKRIDKKQKLFDLIFVISYISLSNYEDGMGTTKLWEKMIAKHLYSKNVAPPVKNNSRFRKFEGAYVVPVMAGMHDWVIAFDLASLYPHIIQQVNIGPETIVEFKDLPPEIRNLSQNGMVEKLLDRKLDTSILDKYNLSMSANGQFYRKDKQSFLSELMATVYKTRKDYKKESKRWAARVNELKEAGATEEEIRIASNKETVFDNLQQGMKIMLNSLYGAVGQKNFLYFRVENAEAITMTGQLVNRWCGRATNKFLKDFFREPDKNFWIAGDTDSGYYSLAPLGNKMREDGMDVQEIVDNLDAFGKVMNKNLDKTCDNLAEYLNSYKQAMIWDREVIAEKAIWTAKKRYIMSVWDNEGLRYKSKPKIKITGMESKKSSTPQWAKPGLVDCYTIALTGEERDLHKYVKAFKKEFMKLRVSDIAIPSGMNNLLGYTCPTNLYKKGTPKHVKAMIIHNKMVRDLGLKHVREVTKDGSKIKYVPLKMPNPSRHPVVGFDNHLPPEFGLDKFVDKNDVWEKGFVKPLSFILDPIGWSHRNINRLI